MRDPGRSLAYYYDDYCVLAIEPKLSFYERNYAIPAKILLRLIIE